MMTFLLYTILGIIANACMAKIIHFSIQHDQWLDKLLNWQERLRKWDEQGKSIVKPLGLCEMCFSHFMAFIGFMFYVLFIVDAELWPFHHWWIWAIWYFVYIGIASMLSLYMIVKMFKK